MKLTTKSEYSILAMIYIARHEKSDYVKIEQICQKYDISSKYLEQLLFILKQNHFIQTKRGSAGGYRLAKPAEDISIADIIRLMDGALAAVESVSRYFYTETPLEKEKKVLSLFKDIRDYISDLLGKRKLSEFV